MDAASKTGVDDVRDLIEFLDMVQLHLNIKYLLLMKFTC